MNDEKAKITALNEIVGIIDSKATEYKSDKFYISEAKAIAGKKLINDLIKMRNSLQIQWLRNR